jgi:predicted transcriptional regulator
MLLRDLVAQDLPMIGFDATLQQAAKRMRSHGQHTLAVFKKGECVGILTSKEIIEKAVAEGMDPMVHRVEDVMSRKVVSCYDDEDVAEAAVSMHENDVSVLVVVDRLGERPTGVISFGDIRMGAVFVATLDSQIEVDNSRMN